MERTALEVIRSGHIATGPAVHEFECEFGKYVGRDNVVTTNDMTSAIFLGLRLAEVGAGDHVATIAFSCLSTNSAIAMVGASPTWIDVDPVTMSMCPDDLAKKLTPRVKAVLLYHVAGYPARVKYIAEICRKNNIILIEDCNNALGAKIDGLPVGTIGDFAVYSFYPNRQINGFEGGALACPDENTAQRAKRLRRFGVDYATFRDARGEINEASDIPEIGISAALSQLNAAVAKCQLDTLGERESKTQENANRLSGLIENISGIKVVEVQTNATSAYWCLLVHSDRRDHLMSALKRDGIACSIMHQRNDIYTGFRSTAVDMSGTSYAMSNLLALPCGWWLDANDVERIFNRIKTECNP